MKTITQTEMLRILEEEDSQWPPFIVSYNGKTWVHIRVAMEGESDLLFRAEVQP